MARAAGAPARYAYFTNPGGGVLAATSVAKVLAPRLPGSFLERPALGAIIDEALARRLTTVVAGPGFGKSTLLGAWSSQGRCAWYTLDHDDAALAPLTRGIVDSLRLCLPGLQSGVTDALEGSLGPDGDEMHRADAIAAALSQMLADQLTSDLVLVLDDVHELNAGAASVRLIEGLVRGAPPELHLVLSSREEPPFSVARLRGRGQLLEVGASMLAFNTDDIAQLLDSLLGEDACELAPYVRELTGGWPAAVRLAVERLRTVGKEERLATLQRLSRPGSPLFNYLAEEVFEGEDHTVRELIRTVAPLERVTADLCEELGVEHAAETLAELNTRGVFLETSSGADGWWRFHSLIRECALEYMPLEPARLDDVRRKAAAWFEEHGQPVEALRVLHDIPDFEETARLLATRGAELLKAGAVDRIVEVGARLPAELRDERVDEVIGHAHQVRGEWERALSCFQRASGTAKELSPALAWRMGLVHHFRADMDEALECYARGRVDGTDLRYEALLDAWRASAHWICGELEETHRFAKRAMDAARASGDQQALAAAHTVMSMWSASVGDRRGNDAHYLHAIEAAERAGDVLQIVRIRNNRGSHFLEEGAYAEALTELDIAVRLAELTDFAVFLGMAFFNRGEVKLAQGRLEESIADYNAGTAVFQRMESRDVGYTIRGLGDVYRERGDLALARAAYEEALSLAKVGRDVQGKVPSLAGLARVLVTEDPERAVALAEEAVALGEGIDHVRALLAKGWVSLTLGEREVAASCAEKAAESARSRRDPAGLAESLELRAASAPQAITEKDRLEEALAIWREIGNRLGEARVELALGRLSDGALGRAPAEAAREKLRALGVRIGSAAAGALAATTGEETPAVAIQSLGGFRVLRAGVPVPLVEWQSKKARDLLKVLMARRGRATPRELLIETLWPDEDDFTKLANRLSVALATVRAVLDPEKRYGADHFVTADKNMVRLDLELIPVDVERFLADAEAGLALYREGRTEEAVVLLAVADASYSGDFLEEDAYEDWAVPLREEARATYISAVRVLAQAAGEAGDFDGAVRYYLRLLERDAYDEDAHLGVVTSLARAGRHGEARRCYRNYVGRMEELGVECAPFPAPVRR